MKVYFIGAGPGDPELITVKAARIISIADIILYTGSLVNPDILSDVKEKALIYDTSGMDYRQITDVMNAHTETDGIIARVHTGDPSLYGTLNEQLFFCEQKSIPYEIIPGVSSFCSAAAALGTELTVPGKSQSIVITRKGGRTPVPPSEALENFARTGSTLVLFLSANIAAEAMKEIQPYYGEDFPAAVVYRASWPDQKICRGTVSTIAGLMKQEGIFRQAIIIVGSVLGEDMFDFSKLYDPGFSHGYRTGVTGSGM